MHNCVISMDLSMTLYLLDEYPEAKKAAALRGKAIYTWHTSGRANWLSLGASEVDSLALVLLPTGLPEHIEMLSDPKDA